MDSLQTTFTSLAVIAIVVLMMVLVCHYLGPRATAWVRSNREEKIGLSKNKLFNANGYMIHSGSDFLLSSSGSFKRFDSIDRDYKQVGQNSITSPLWNITQTDIPPQPLRPAPAPMIPLSTKIKEINEKSSKEKTIDIENNCSTAIPRPIAKKQFSNPYRSESINVSSLSSSSDLSQSSKSINLSDAVEKIQNKSRIDTNPFLNGSLDVAEFSSNDNNLDNPHNCDTAISNRQNFHSEIKLNKIYSQPSLETSTCLDLEPNYKNPFTADCIKLKELKNIHIFNGKTNETEVANSNYFNFEPENITSILKQPQFQNSEIIPLEIIKNDQNDVQVTKVESTVLSPTLVTTTATTTMTLNKFLDSPCADTFDNIEKMLKRHFRNRSMSDTEATVEFNIKQTFANRSSEYFPIESQSTNPFLDNDTSSSLIHKTLSENYLATTSNNIINNNNNNINNGYSNHFWNFGRSFSIQESSFNLGRRNSSQSSLDERGSLDSINLQRALSCESVSSESSVVLSDLEQPVPPITGYLCVGLHHDKNSISEDGMELIVTVMEAKELIGPSNCDTFDTFVRIYLVPDETGAMQTKLFKNSTSPSYNETFCFWLNKKRGRHSLWFHLYHSGNVHTLIGEAEMQICDVSRPITTWLPLSDSRQNNINWGELMFSLSYLPTAERLTVVVVKGRNLKLDQNGKEASIDLQQNIFIKVYLLKNDKKVSKKKTSLKRTDRCPIFNESMIFSVPPYVLNSIQVRLTVMSISSDSDKMLPIGHVIVGSNTSGKGLRHWHQMLSSLRKPVAMWHPLRRTITKNNKNDVT